MTVDGGKWKKLSLHAFFTGIAMIANYPVGSTLYGVGLIVTVVSGADLAKN